MMLGGFICQGALEEVLCRGIALQRLKDRTPIPVAVGISTALFIIPHLANLSGASAGIILFAIVDLVLISLIFSFLRNYAEFIQSFYAETNRLLRRFSNRNVLIISA